MAGRRVVVAPFFLLIGLACSTSPTIPAGPATIAAVGSPSGTPGWLLDEPLEVRLRDAAGRPVEGALVTWSTDESAAWLGSDSSYSDEDGIARMEFAPGWRTGVQKVNAIGGGLTIAISVQVATLELAMVANSADRYCGIDRDGSLWCWTRGGLASVGAPPARRGENNLPVQVDPGVRYTQVLDASSDTNRLMCGLTDAGALRCWSVADPTPGGTTTPVPFRHIASTSWPALALCGLDAQGQAWCRGSNAVGQLGDGTTTDRAAFAPVAGAVRFGTLAGGFASFCGLDTNDRAWCWGDDFGTPTLRQPAPYDANHRHAMLGFMHGGVCGLELGVRQLRCWGPSRMGTGPAPGGEAFVVPAPEGLVELAGKDALGIFRTVDGRILFAGDMAHDMFVNRFVQTPEEFEWMPTGISSVLSRDGDSWCVAHVSGSSLCGVRVGRPVGVPAPR
ncbi:MAG: hypothetical protein KDB31_05010 [Microthrixaceae bacterium]|nr:hypothetical protein [Microthrixaceae bacterium]